MDQDVVVKRVKGVKRSVVSQPMRQAQDAVRGRHKAKVQPQITDSPTRLVWRGVSSAPSSFVNSSANVGRVTREQRETTVMAKIEKDGRTRWQMRKKAGSRRTEQQEQEQASNSQPNGFRGSKFGWVVDFGAGRGTEMQTRATQEPRAATGPRGLWARQAPISTNDPLLIATPRTSFLPVAPVMMV